VGKSCLLCTLRIVAALASELEKRFTKMTLPVNALMLGVIFMARMAQGVLFGIPKGIQTLKDKANKNIL